MAAGIGASVLSERGPAGWQPAIWWLLISVCRNGTSLMHRKRYRTRALQALLSVLPDDARGGEGNQSTE